MWIAPWLGEGGTVRRTNRVLPEARQRQRAESTQANEEEVVTTARRQPLTDPLERLRRQRETAQQQADIQTLSGMFPNVRRNVIEDVLQRRCVVFPTWNDRDGYPGLTRLLALTSRLRQPSS